MNQLLSLTPQGKEELMRSVIARYLTGERVEDLAKEYGCSRWTLNQALVTHAEEAWRDAQCARAVARLADAEDMLDNARDAFDLAKGREILKSAQWQLERVYRRIYGTDNPNLNQPAIHISIGIDRREEKAVND